MKGRHDLSRIAALSFCVILLLSLVEFPEREPFGLHLASDGEQVLLSESDVEDERNQLPESVPVIPCLLLDDGPRSANVAVVPGPSPRSEGPVDARRSSPDEPGPTSSTVQRI